MVGTSSARPASHVVKETRAEAMASAKEAVVLPGCRSEPVATRTVSAQAATCAVANAGGVTARASLRSSKWRWW